MYLGSRRVGFEKILDKLRTFITSSLQKEGVEPTQRETHRLRQMQRDRQHSFTQSQRHR